MERGRIIAPMQPFPYPAISCETSATDAYPRVLAAAGASLARDAVDHRIAEEVKTGKPRFGNHGIIDSQKDAGGWPELRSLPAPLDSDQDGMPDAWENAHGLNPAIPPTGIPTAMATATRIWSNS